MTATSLLLACLLLAGAAGPATAIPAAAAPPALAGEAKAGASGRVGLPSLDALLATESPPDAARLLAVARDAFRAQVAAGLPEGLAATLVPQAEESLALAQDLLGRVHPRTLGEAVEAAASVTRWQARLLAGGQDPAAPAASVHALPSQALRGLLPGDVAPSPQQEAGLAALDALPEPLRARLAGFVAAFLAFQQANRDAFAAVDVGRLDRLVDNPMQGLPAGQAPDPARMLSQAGLELGPILSARLQLLQAASAFKEAATQAQEACSAGGVRVAMPPYFSVDLRDVDNLYTDDTLLQVDACGNDTYHNNAGGNNLSPVCPLEALVDEFILNNPAAALVDLSGDDSYGDPLAPRSCGVNGGGHRGSGFLFDAEGGNDLYTALRASVNGGGFTGTGFLLDGGGNDVYSANSQNANGGGAAGQGLLVDAAGDDQYRSGGAQLPMACPPGSCSTNGGGYNGFGALLDLGAGSDLYTAGAVGSNGGGLLGGHGFLLDGGGDDAYTSTAPDGSVALPSFCSLGFPFCASNGGGGHGIGFLLDVAGNDAYTAVSQGTNGGGFEGIGFLLDAAGNDQYTAANRGTNGGAVRGLGFLLDGGGNDGYTAGSTGTNGGSSGGAGFLLNVGGTDTYTAIQAGSGSAIGLGVNGGVDLAGAGSGLLLDAGGIGDTYAEDLPGAGDPLTTTVDTSVLTKGNLGNQLDLLSNQVP